MSQLQLPMSVPNWNSLVGSPQDLALFIGWIENAVYLQAGRDDLVHSIPNEDVNELRDFFTESMLLVGTESLVNALENISTCVAWRKIGGISLSDPYINYDQEKALRRLMDEQAELQQMIWSRLGNWVWLQRDKKRS